MLRIAVIAVIAVTVIAVTVIVTVIAKLYVQIVHKLTAIEFIFCYIPLYVTKISFNGVINNKNE